MNRSVSTVSIFCAVVIACIAYRHVASHHQVTRLGVSNREVGVCLCALDCRLVLIIVAGTASIQRLRIFRAAFDGVEDKLEYIPAGTGAPIPYSLCLIVGDHVIVRLISGGFFPGLRSQFSVISQTGHIGTPNAPRHHRTIRLLAFHPGFQSQLRMRHIGYSDQIILCIGYVPPPPERHLHSTDIHSSIRFVVIHSLDGNGSRGAVIIPDVIAAAPLKQRVLAVQVIILSLFRVRGRLKYQTGVVQELLAGAGRICRKFPQFCLIYLARAPEGVISFDCFFQNFLVKIVSQFGVMYWHRLLFSINFCNDTICISRHLILLLPISVKLCQPVPNLWGEIACTPLPQPGSAPVIRILLLTGQPVLRLRGRPCSVHNS